MNRSTAVVLIVGSLSALSFADPPGEMHPGGRMLDVLRPGMTVKVSPYSSQDDLGVRVEILSQEALRELMSKERERRQEIATLERQEEELRRQYEAVSELQEQLRKSQGELTRGPRTSDEVKRIMEIQSQMRESATNQQESIRERQKISNSINLLRAQLPSAYNSIAQVGEDYFSVESPYGVTWYPADRIRVIHQSKFRPNAEGVFPVEATRPAM